MTLYERLANDYIEAINSQRLPLGSRMPALRVLAKQHGVSLTTATKAYDYLQQHGWIYARPQSGYYVANQMAEATFPQLEQREIKARDPKFYSPSLGYNVTHDFFAPLGTSMIAPELLPSTELQRCIKRVTSRHALNLLNYPNPQGEVALRKALGRHFREANFAFCEQELVITNGCIDAVRSAIEITTNPGDTIAVSSPCFSGLLDLLENMGRLVIEIPCYQAQLDLEQLEERLKSKRISACLFSANHINPQGFCLSNQQTQRIAELAAHYQVPVIEDDIYLELSYSNTTPLPIKYWDKSGWVLWCSSVSKTIAAGYRLGWCEPGRYFNDYLQLRNVQFFGVNNIVQHTVCEFINTGQYAKHLKKLTTTLASHARQYHSLLRELLPGNTKISVAEGGMVIWLQLDNMDSQAVLSEALKQGVPFRAGSEFTTLAYYQNCLRLNIGWPIVANAKDTPDKQAEALALSAKLVILCELINANVAVK